MTRTVSSSVSISLVVASCLLFSAASASAQNPLFEVEGDGAAKLLQVNDDAGFLVRGTLNTGTIPATGSGSRLMWYPSKAAVRGGSVDGGQWDDQYIGKGSTAWGQNSQASGDYSNAWGYGSAATGQLSTALGNGVQASGLSATALGNQTIAGGSYSTAMGVSSQAIGKASTAMNAGNIAQGDNSTAMGEGSRSVGASSLASGYHTLASGNYSITAGFGTQATAERAVAFGDNTTASAIWSVAMGDHTTASGASSVALGSYVAAGVGSFIFGDRSSTSVQGTGTNQFIVRAYGGVGFNSAPGIGCDLNPGSGAWSCTSSRLAKEAFEGVDGEEILTKLADLPIERWRYIGTTADHVGPFAEDFHAAFGLGESATKISTVDAEGIALRAIQALERRTEALQQENAELTRRLDALEKQSPVQAQPRIMP